MATNMPARKGLHFGVRNLGETDTMVQPIPMIEIFTFRMTVLADIYQSPATNTSSLMET